MVRVPVEMSVAVDDLMLRRWSVDDAAPLLAAIERSLPELREWMPWASVQPNLESVRAFLGTTDAPVGHAAHGNSGPRPPRSNMIMVMNASAS